VNYQNLGLSNSPNGSKSAIHQEQSTIGAVEDGYRDQPCKAIELYDIPDSDTLKQIKNQGKLPVSVENQKYMRECFSKYGDDYKSMSRDIKVNNMQHTENFLRKLGARFLLLNDSQRKVDVPENIKHLIA